MRRRQSSDSSESSSSEQELRRENERLQAAVQSACNAQIELRQLVEHLTAAPWHAARMLQIMSMPQGTRALVWTGEGARAVGLHPDVDPSELPAGGAVFLSTDRNLVMSPAPEELLRTGETAVFERFTPDGRLVLRSRDEELVAEASARLDVAQLRSGDHVLLDRYAKLAIERFENENGRSYLLEDVEDLPRERLGGLGRGFEKLVSVLTASLVDPQLAAEFQLDGRRAVLLYGPPGCGKTLMARIATAEIQRLVGKRCRFAVVRPGEFQSPYVGEAEANIRACFRALREAAGDDQAILFLDEIEAIGRVRGTLGAHHSDCFLAALLSELDGFSERGQIAVVAATNRRDLLDPALLSRLADTQIAVPRPDRRAALEILGIHLPESLPYDGHAPKSRAALELRSEMIEMAASLLYAPNADNEICELQLRDGTLRTVRARELLSGRLLEHVARSARERAFRRRREQGHGGVVPRDLSAAVSDAIASLSTTLSVFSVRAHLDDLPDDVDVMRVDPARHLPAQPQQYAYVVP
jgi:ATP-dependent 26S proteasome regulatory subunit